MIPRRSIAFAVLFAGCGGGPSAPSTQPALGSASPSPTATSAAVLSITGDPESSSGATWTLRGTFEGTAFDLQGILAKPRGTAPFPAVILSHGFGGNANGYARNIAREMVSWGLVCIATNYTHAAGVPLGSPGTEREPGASAANVLRAHATREVRARLGYVDLNRLAAHGHSMGAFLTAALVGAYPDDFRAASHTAGGVRSGGSTEAAAPVEAQVTGIRAPYQMHHGDEDTVVPLALDRALASILESRGVTMELIIYPGAGHADVSQSPEMLNRVRDWYRAKGLF